MKKTVDFANWSFLIKSLIFILVGFFIFYVVSHKPNFNRNFLQAILNTGEYSHYYLYGAILLFPFNWGLEALKWQYLVSKIEKIGFLKAYRGILTGLTFGFITPHGIGDYPGRVLQLDNKDRLKALGAVFLSRISQFYITLYFGSISLFYYVNEVHIGTDALFNNLIFGILLLFNAAFILIFIFHKRLLEIIHQLKIFTKMYRYIEILHTYSRKDIARILVFSMLRYLVFSSQFLLLLSFFKVSSNYLLMSMGIAFVFLFKSIIPTFFDFGVRETSAVYFFESFNYDNEKVIFASLTLWVINILIPTLAGMLFIFKLKLFPPENK